MNAGYARRKVGQSSSVAQPDSSQADAVVYPNAAAEPSPPLASGHPLSADPNDQLLLQEGSSALTPTPPLTPTGRPSLIHTVVSFALKVVKPLVTVFDRQANSLLNGIPFVSDGVPPFYLTHGLKVGRYEFEGMPVWSLTPPDPTGKQVVAVHGGAYTVQILPMEWSTYTAMARDTGATVLVPIYPLAPRGTVSTVVPTIGRLITSVIADHGAENVSLVGASAGGGIALAAAQQLVIGGETGPSNILLISPWLDLTVSDPRSQSIAARDPLLATSTLVRSGKLWAGDLPGGAANPLASPLNGSLEGLPPIFVYTSTSDVLSLDSLRFKIRADLENANVTLTYRRGLFHGWLTFPFFPEAVAERPGIYRHLGLTNTN